MCVRVCAPVKGAGEGYGGDKRRPTVGRPFPVALRMDKLNAGTMSEVKCLHPSEPLQQGRARGVQHLQW